MPSATTLLEQDHRTVEKLFAQFKQANDPSIATRICEELGVHTEVEEEIIYPVLRGGGLQ
ncbi:MAG TPA: hemerythrin domain-containing protein [Acidimicrobiia bacterium]|nr:hemerythrin domain-containing protein [Acidimicrobiia bacterium]